MMCLLPANAATHAGAASAAGGFTGPDLTSRASLLFDSESSSSSPESSSPVTSDDDTPAQPAPGWRRSQAHPGSARGPVECASPPQGEQCPRSAMTPRLPDRVEPSPAELLPVKGNLAGPLAAKSPGGALAASALVKVTFCNMRQNMSDLRRKRMRSRKKSRDSIKRRSSTLSTASSSTAASLSSSVTSDIEDEPALKKALPVIQECEVRPDSVADSHLSILTHPRVMEDELESGLSDLENNESLLKTCSQGSLLVLSSEHPVSITTTHNLAHSSNETLIIKSDLEILQPSNICQPQVDESRTSYFEDEIAEACDLDTADWLSDDEDQASSDLNGSFLRSFLNQIQNDQRYNCSIPLVDVFQNSPLDSFICYGCSMPYSKSNAFTINLTDQTVSVICGHCQWWTTRTISTQTYSF